MSQPRESAPVGPEPCSFCGWTGQFDGHACDEVLARRLAEEALRVALPLGEGDPPIHPRLLAAAQAVLSSFEAAPVTACALSGYPAPCADDACHAVNGCKASA